MSDNKELLSIVSEEEMLKCFENTNFGDVDKRSLIKECLLKYATGYVDGYTITCICKELKLLTSKNAISKKGKEYLFLSYYQQVNANGWVEVEELDYNDIIEVDEDVEGRSSSKSLFAVDSKGEYHIVYAICEDEDGSWTTNGFYDNNGYWREDIVRVKKIS